VNFFLNLYINLNGDIKMRKKIIKKKMNQTCRAHQKMRWALVSTNSITHNTINRKLKGKTKTSRVVRSEQAQEFLIWAKDHSHSSQISY
jgi:hypothetical protein